MVEKVRVAFGTGVVLGLWHGKLEAAPTAAHFLTYFEGRCSANCKFCPQARESTADPKMLSRVIWPHYEFKKVLVALGENSNEFQRICIQAVNYPGVVDDVCEATAEIKNTCALPISVSCQPLERKHMERLLVAGVDRICVALDAATPEVFEQVKGGDSGYRWESHMRALEDAHSVFRNKVTTHLIIGLGETEQEAVGTVQQMHDCGVNTALFAFTPIPKTPMADRPRPDVGSYRRVQLARHLIVKGMSTALRMKFDGGRVEDFGVGQEELLTAINSREPFRTSGCPGCNRPFYNESPRGPIYNYPRKPTSSEMEVIQAQLFR